MGNICASPKRSKNRSYSVSPSVAASVHSDDSSVYVMDPEDVKYSETVRDMKEYHKSRLRRELEEDHHTFVLDNLLMCVQFFDNFEQARDAGNAFKRDIEREMMELLASDHLDGMILGDRRMKLLSGLSHILSKNYIYRGDLDDDVDLYYGGIGYKDTFTPEGILPLEFIKTWDNLEVYLNSQVETLKEYSNAKDASPIGRYSMEEPAKSAEFPKGYVRLLCVDDPISFRKRLEAPQETSSDFGYAGEPIYSKPLSETVSEAFSDPGSPTGDEEDEEEEDEEYKSFKENVRNAGGFSQLTKSKTNLKSTDEPMPSTSKDGMNHSNFPGSRPRPPRLQLRAPSQDHNPMMNVQEATPEPFADSPHPLGSFESFNSLRPPARPYHKMLNPLSRSAPSLMNDPVRDSPGKESSGYATTSTRSIASSGGGSDMMRSKWQKQNLKRLLEFGHKSRKSEIPSGGKYDSLPSNCYSEVKFEKLAYDDERDDDEEDDSDSSDTDDSETSTDSDYDSNGNKKRKKKIDEEDYEMRIYVNSSQFSANACAEFHGIGTKMRLPRGALSNAVVLGTTIRCPIPYTYPLMIEEEDVDSLGNYHVTYTFTPALHCKSWPTSLYFHFNQQVFGRAEKGLQGEMWPTREQMDQIEQLHGCNAIPLGYRSTNFFNAEQILEWELNFHECEMTLLNSLRNAHWRTYIFVAILYRAFLAPLGPQGVGFEHIRNVLYFMCHDNFTGWNDEQPGLHLIKLIDMLYNYLSRTEMPSFFVRSRNLLQGIPPQNIRFVQAHLKQIRENIIVYMIYSFRNLMDVRRAETSYSMPNFKHLFDLLTADQDGDLLRLRNPVLQMQKDREDAERREQARRKSRKRRHVKSHDLLSREDEIEREFTATQRERQASMSQLPKKKDRMQKRLKQGYEKFQEQQAEKQRTKQEQEHEKLRNNPDHRVPDRERRKSINLKRSPVLVRGKFSKFRLLLMIEFFLRQFLHMAQKAFEMNNFSLATMYTLQIENLCELIQEKQFEDVISPISEDDLEDYRQQTLRMRAYLGKDIKYYIVARVAQPPSPQTPTGYIEDPLSFTNGPFPTFISNWDLRKSKRPPAPEREIPKPGKKLEKPNIASSLRSLPKRTMESPPPPHPLPTVPSSLPTTPLPSSRAPRRRESIKFVGSPSLPPDDEIPPATPPRPRSAMGNMTPRMGPRPSITLADEKVMESTDL